MKTKKWFNLCVPLLLLALSAFAFTGHAELVMDQLLGTQLEQTNDHYLKTSFDQAIVGFGVMSAWKAGLDIIEGSEVGANIGVSAQLQVGDIVQPAYDYVDIAWHTLFFGSVTLLGIQYLLEAAELIDGYVVSFALLMLSLGFAAAWLFPMKKRLREMIRDVAGVSVVASLALFYILPLSVRGAGMLSQIITAPAIAEANQGFSVARDEIFPDTQQADESWAKRVKAIPGQIEHIGTYLKDEATKMVIWTIKLVAGYIFDCIVFPVTLFVLLLWFTRSILGYIFHRNMQRTFRDDLEEALEQASSSK